MCRSCKRIKFVEAESIVVASTFHFIRLAAVGAAAASTMALHSLQQSECSTNNNFRMGIELCSYLRQIQFA